MRADLHTHSIYSDGFYTPAQIADIAAAAGVNMLSITDHDNMDGDDEKRSAIEAGGLIYVPGWEISSYDELGRKIHITGYNCSRSSPAYKEFMRARIEGGYVRAEDIIKKLRTRGIYITMEEVEAQRPVKSAPIHTMHVARAIAAKGYYKDEFEVYRKCLSRGQFAHSGLGRPSPYEALRVISECGGISSLAHPGRIEMEDEEKEELIRGLARAGLNGIEAVYTTHTLKQTEYFKSLARGLSLFVTGGSDTHKQGLGGTFIGSPAFEPDEALLAALKIGE